MSQYLFLLSQRIWYCPVCAGQLIGHGSYDRQLKTFEDPVTIPIARYQCKGCDKTHAMIPDFVAPYRHYPMPVIESTVMQVVDAQVLPEQVDGDQDISTTRRWVRKFKAVFAEAIGMLSSMGFRHSNQLISLTSQSITSCWQRLGAALARLPDLKSSTRFGQANLWLTSETTSLFM